MTATWTQFGLLFLAVATPTVPALDVGQPVPAWQLDGPDGAHWSSELLRGQVVVLEFWASWCKQCERNMPEVARTVRDYAGQPVQVIAVNILENGDPVSYMEENGSGIPYALNGDELAASLGVKAVPAVVVIDAEGRVALKLLGAGRGRNEGLRAAVDDLLGPTAE